MVPTTELSGSTWETVQWAKLPESRTPVPNHCLKWNEVQHSFDRVPQKWPSACVISIQTARSLSCYLCLVLVQRPLLRCSILIFQHLTALERVFASNIFPLNEDNSTLKAIRAEAVFSICWEMGEQ